MKFGNSMLRYAGVLAGAELPSTQTTPKERELLIKHLPGKRRIVELGVFEGFTTNVLAAHADKGAIIFGVDPFFVGRIGISWGLHMARAYNARALREGRVKLVRALSTAVTGEIPMPIDFLFVDADHSMEGIVRDWEFWSQRIAPGGIIALHDSLVPAHNLNVKDYGSHIYFESHIRRDPRFTVVGTADSLAVLQRQTGEGAPS